MRFPICLKSLFIALVALAFAGCVTQRADWQTRIGNYTYDQAVRDYGPPDKSAKLNDGSTVADWLIHRGHTVAAPEPYLMSPGGFDAAQPAFNRADVPSYYMRLTFGPDGKLQHYKNFSR